MSDEWCGYPSGDCVLARELDAEAAKREREACILYLLKLAADIELERSFEHWKTQSPLYALEMVQGWVNKTIDAIRAREGKS